MAKKTKTTNKQTNNMKRERVIPPEISEVEKEIDIDPSIAQAFGIKKTMRRVYVINFDGNVYGDYGLLADAKRKLKQLQNPGGLRGKSITFTKWVSKQCTIFEKRLAKDLSLNDDEKINMQSIINLLQSMSNPLEEIETEDDLGDL